MALKLETARRLAYIRYLHQLGMDQARLPEPLSSASILMLHDAAESLLVLACEHVDVEPPGQFERFWTVLADKVPGDGIPTFQGMRRLNKVRVALKHHGAHPSADGIQQAVADASTFMASTTQLVFGVDYDAVSMVQVISQDAVRELCEESELSAAESDYITAMMRLREAFDLLFDSHESYSGYDSGSPFSFGPSLTPFQLDKMKIRRVLVDGRDDIQMRLGREIDQLSEDIVRLMRIAAKTQAGIRISVVGIDYPSYLRFMNLCPGHVDTMDGIRHWYGHEGYSPTREIWEFGLQFVVTSSMHIAAAEANLEDPEWVSRDVYGTAKYVDLREEQRRPRGPVADGKSERR